MGMASSRRYGMQGITLVTTSTKSNWRVYFASTVPNSPYLVKWYSLGNIYQGRSPVIDFSGNTGGEKIVIKCKEGLYAFSAQSTELTVLDVSKSEKLKVLVCGFNTGISVLDVSKNLELNHLECNDTGISVLDVSKNLELKHLNCKNTLALTTIYVNQNQLDVANRVKPAPQGWGWGKDAHTKYVLKQ
ncbi:hypothetical protein G1L01_13140 [Tenacibaculum finnmarkense]|uniref:hypothetical protein n=1 Tax=Tenacibaculum finnmarkense TaxID=2781243 RepID=UPI001EFC1A78|nr:hypothetical protein [Tenacibaculum finnmarkense]MCG8203669.1 hypothetical protein [Tenacibaculum finnmarkense genomovar finnmarkense]MCG8881402.1 hypothetical protein [Tenacibaculum finnmarkense]MCM8866366.1 hypothetical protein [Tenacibaculum finnmarkense genomovar finnmarkense]MCM8888307.1 hypothetical protein [Tenacibaculum finnmarkense genomovar finnmarkense]MCM8896922.1 hypothetical protein [Tenacibaculum finnmarkense genomovar finnmarkense]